MECLKRTVWLISLLFTCHCDRISYFETRLSILEKRVNSESEARSHDTSAIYRRLDEMNMLINATLEERFANYKSDCFCESSNRVDEENLEELFRKFQSDVELLNFAFQREKLRNLDIRKNYAELESKIEQLRRQTDSEDKTEVLSQGQHLEETKSERLTEKRIKTLEDAHEKDKDETKRKFAELDQQNERLVKALNELKVKEIDDIDQKFTSCKDAFNKGFTTSGINYIKINDGYDKVKVYCDQETDNGGWTVFQRRGDGSEDFYRGWDDYRNGFGDVGGEFWLGNKYIHCFTAGQSRELRIDMGDFEGNKAFAKYKRFRILNENENYTLSVYGYEGNAGDALTSHNGRSFTTKDRDNDIWEEESCALILTAVWWYASCYDSNLNGVYRTERSLQKNGVVWYQWKTQTYSLKYVEMKLR